MNQPSTRSIVVVGSIVIVIVSLGVGAYWLANNKLPFAIDFFSSRASAPTASYPCTNDDPQAKLVNQVLPPGSMTANQQAGVSVTVANCSGQTWSSPALMAVLPTYASSLWGTPSVSFGQSVPTNTQITLSFTVTAPSADGTYPYQWAVTTNGTSPIAPYLAPALIGVGGYTTCTRANTVKNTGQDARPILQNCIDQTPENQTLEIPAGTYVLHDQLKTTKAITLRTQGTAGNQQPCLTQGALACAILKAASDYPLTKDFNSYFGLIRMSYNIFETNLNHIVFDGNRDNRAGIATQLPEALYWGNWYIGDNGKFFYNAFINTLGAKGLEVIGNHNVIAYNYIANNGGHFQPGNLAGNTNGKLEPISDGLAIEGKAATVYGNIFRDNSDVDFIAFSTPDAMINFNTVIHTDPNNAAYGGFMLGGDAHQLSEPGDFRGTDVSYNYINCNYRCTVAFEVGSGPWYPVDANVYGASIHNNIIMGGLLGMNISGVHPTGKPKLRLENNIVSNSGGYATGEGWTSGLFNLSPNASIDMVGTGTQPDTRRDWTTGTAPSRFLFAFQYFVNTPSMARLTKGVFEQADCVQLAGWACDETDYHRPIMVQFYKDAPYYQGGVSIGQVQANLAGEQAIGASCGGNSAHRFVVPTFNTLNDGQTHAIYAYGISVLPDGGNPELLSHKTITCPAPTSTPSPTLTPTPTPSTTFTSTPTPTPTATITVRPKPQQYGLTEGDTVAAYSANDPDIYIVNDSGFKRLFLNPIIFSFYGHLSFSNVKNISASTRDIFETSGIFRNCETGDLKTYAVEINGEDTGILHHINLTGSQAAQQDPEFFQKVFCINNNEFNWYTNGGRIFGVPYTNLSQIPRYQR